MLTAQGASLADDVGPFELLQARQLIESEVAAFSATQTTKNDIARMREVLDMKRRNLAAGNTNYRSDEMFHLMIAEATQNTVLRETVRSLWQRGHRSAMWLQLHRQIVEQEYHRQWLDDHQAVWAALRARTPDAADNAMWSHLQHARETLLAISYVEAPNFDGFLFTSAATEKAAPEALIQSSTLGDMLERMQACRWCSRLSKGRSKKMTFRWYGDDDPATLDKIRQVPRHDRYRHRHS